jgi:hypothetical protein
MQLLFLSLCALKLHACTDCTSRVVAYGVSLILGNVGHPGMHGISCDPVWSDANLALTDVLNCMLLTLVMQMVQCWHPAASTNMQSRLALSVCTSTVHVSVHVHPWCGLALVLGK